MIARSLLLAYVFALSTSTWSQVIWNEDVHGDLSGDRFNPTSLNLGWGSNVVIGSMGEGDREYVHFHLAPGMELSQLRVLAYVSTDPLAFIGVQEGTIFTEPHEGANPGNLLGYTLWGPQDIGVDILPRMGQAPSTIGFTPPLTGSDYTFWIQQTGDPTDYSLDFVTVPEPATISLGIGVAAILLRRRARQTR